MYLRLFAPIALWGLFAAGFVQAAEKDPCSQLVRLALRSPLEQFQSALTVEHEEIAAIVGEMKKRGTASKLEERLRAAIERNELLVRQTLALGNLSLATEDSEAVRIAYAEALHDLRNLLGSVAALEHHFPRGQKMDKTKLKEMLDASQDATRKGLDIVEHMLSGKPMPLRKQTVSARTLFRGVEKLTRGFPDNIKVEWDAPVDLPSVEGDTLALSRALLNLCTNARHALPNGGTIRLRASRLKGANANINAEGSVAYSDKNIPPNIQYLVLSVVDNGTGIPPETLLHIFTAGFTTRAETGQGLGLSSTVGVAEKHGGFVSVNSKVGRGTRFRIFLPIAGERLGEPVPKELPEGTVLAADDSSAFRMLMGAALRKIEQPHHSVASGNALVQVLQAHPDKVKLVFLDANMPGFTLEETIEEIRAIRPDLPIILASGDADLGRVSGAAAVMPKPYDVAVIADYAKNPPQAPKK